MSDTPVSDVPPPADPTATEASASPLDALQREKDELYDRLLRKTAEFDNFKKRTERERREFADWAAAELIGEVLAVVDDFERALAVEAPPEAAKYREGVEIIHRQLLDLVKKRGVQPIETLGADFDPAWHQAVAYDESPGARDGEIVAELRRGYRLGDRLLRPALVRVAKAS
ncbi:MAG: nucleotide exchange factor GrpE [Vicinamibacterales bacterium]